jgi:tripartite-type tricarboxylate transporter receptor subunit TctC
MMRLCRVHYQIINAVALFIAILAEMAPAQASEERFSFSDKQLTMIVGFPPGGGTDAVARLVANHFTKRLPDHPPIIIRNMPGANGITAMNYLVQQIKPDGFTLTMGASQSDPATFRRPNAHYDPSRFLYIGGIGRGGSTLIINLESEKRLHNGNAEPVIMGSIAGMPRSGMLMAAWGIEYLGWNSKWVIGYPGTNEIMLALDRGEIDMTSTGNVFQIEKLVSGGKFKVLCQSGYLQGDRMIGSADFGEAPVFSDLLKEKIADPIGQKALDYFVSQTASDKWLALPPGSPTAALNVYRDAFELMSDDPEFVSEGKAVSDAFVPMTSSEVELLTRNLVNTPDEAVDFIKVLLRKQGVRVE